MDSFQFMSSSLDKLVDNLSNEAIKCTKQEFNVEEFTLMKKRVFILMTWWTVLKSLIKENYLKKEDFFSLLSNENITEEQYQHPETVCETFAVKTMGDY